MFECNLFKLSLCQKLEDFLAHLPPIHILPLASIFIGLFIMLIFLLPLLVGILVTPSLCDDPQNNCTSQLRDYREIVKALLHPGRNLLIYHQRASNSKLLILLLLYIFVLSSSFLQMSIFKVKVCW